MNNLLICKGISKNSCSFLAFLLFTFILIAPAAAQTLKEHDRLRQRVGAGFRI